MVTLQSRPRRRERVLAQRAAETVVVLDPDSGHYFSLDDVGALVWELCDGTRDLGQIAALVCEEYDAALATAESDVLELAAELSSVELIDCDA